MMISPKGHGLQDSKSTTAGLKLPESCANQMISVGVMVRRGVIHVLLVVFAAGPAFFS